jgi:hypothetical protein
MIMNIQTAPTTITSNFFPTSFQLPFHPFESDRLSLSVATDRVPGPDPKVISGQPFECVDFHFRLVLG